MKRLVLSLCLLLAFAMSAYAGCVTKQQVIAFTDMDSSLRICRILDQAGGDYPDTKMKELLAEWQNIQHRLNPNMGTNMKAFFDGFKEGWNKGKETEQKETKAEKSLAQLNKEQTVKKAIAEGTLIVFPANTKVDRVDEFKEHFSWVIIKDLKVMIPNNAVSCD